LTEAKATVADEKKPFEKRVAAVRLLALASFADVSGLLTELLASRQPPDVQAAAIETLARFGDTSVVDILLGAWSGLSPKVRATASEAFFSRPAWIHAFLDAVEKGRIARADVDPARLDLLKAYPDARVKERAAKVFAGGGLAR